MSTGEIQDAVPEKKQKSRSTANKVVVILEANKDEVANYFINVISLKQFMENTGLNYDDAHALISTGETGSGLMSYTLTDALVKLYNAGNHAEIHDVS